MSVLVTNASGAKGLIVTRSLGKKNIDIVNTDSKRFSSAFFSKYSKDHFLSPSPKECPDQYISVLLDNITSKNIDFLLPVNSDETLLVSKYRNKLLKKTGMVVDDYSKILMLHDKGNLLKVADEFNIPMPITYDGSAFEAIDEIANKLNYPVVIKLKNSTSSIGLSYAYSKEEFIAQYNKTIEIYSLSQQDYPLIQEYVPGPGYGVSLLMNHGELRALFTHKRLREYPVTGGPSTIRESVRHHEMEKIAIELMEHLEWHGVAMFEFKLNESTNKPYLLEVNPRFWGSVNQAISSGVDFPYLLYKMGQEGDVKPVLSYKLGVRTGLMFNDFRAQFSLLRGSQDRKSFFIKGFDLRSKINDDVVSISDPLPILPYLYTNIIN